MGQERYKLQLSTDPCVNLIVRGLSIGAKGMKPLFVAFLSTAAICAFVSATPVVAQETITGAPKGEAPITAEPAITPSYGPGYGDGPLDEIVDAIAGSSANTTQPDPGRHVTPDPDASQGEHEYRGVP
jgi:hypothetical protein